MIVFCFLVVVLVTLRVFWLLSWLLSMFSGCCLGYSPYFLVVVLINTINVLNGSFSITMTARTKTGLNM